jgi:acetyl esterase/lipase
LPPDPAAVPTKVKLSGLPQTWLGVGDADPLLSRSVEFAEQLRGAGLPHAFVMMSRLYKGADAALDDAAAAAKGFVQR